MAAGTRVELPSRIFPGSRTERSKDLTQSAQRSEHRGHGETWVARNENAKRFPQGLKPSSDESSMSELKLRPLSG
jgi:hypothetical protein